MNADTNMNIFVFDSKHGAYGGGHSGGQGSGYGYGFASPHQFSGGHVRGSSLRMQQ